MSKPEGIVLDHSSWNLKELLLLIIQRYFDLGNEVLDGQAWEARAKAGRSDSEALIELNSEFEPLGYLAMLDEGNPPILSIAPYPDDQQIIPNWQMSLVWLMMAGFLTLIGSAWLQQYHLDATAFDSDLLRESVLYMALPMMLALGLASEARRRMAAHFGVDIGHVVPLAFPIMSPSWPFGLAGVLSQRRPDLLPIPNRRALALIEFTAPVVIFSTGTLLTLLGLHLTPLEPPELSSAPIAFQNNPLITLLAHDWLGDSLWIKLQWIHLTGLTGIGLTLLGWTLLLPIPGLPGDRIMHALIGPAKMSDSSRQTTIFIAMLAAMVVVFANTDYMPWLLIVALGAMRRFSPENSPSPLVVDESLIPSSETRNRFIAILLFVMIAGFPGMTPSYALADWDGGLDTSGWDDEIDLTISETYNLSLELTPAGVTEVSGWLQFRLEGENAHAWEISSPQFNEFGFHRFDGVTQSSEAMVSITITPLDIALDNPTFVPDTSMLLRILIDVEGHIDEHLTVLLHPTTTSPIDPLWLLIEDTETPRICVSVDKVDSTPANLALTNPFWEFENETNLTEAGLHDVCLRGHKGALQSSPYHDEYRRLMGPVLALEYDDGEHILWWMPINGTEIELRVSDQDWGLPYWLASNLPYTITYGVTGNAFCPSSIIVPEMETSGPWNWTFSDRSTIMIPAGDNGDGTLYFESAGWLAFCQMGDMMRSYRLVEGEDVLLVPGDLDSGLTLSQYVIVNRENTSMDVRVEWTGDAPSSDVWEVSIPDFVEAHSDVVIDISPSGELSLYRAAWVSVDEGEITVHLAARCPVDGCEVG